LAKKAYGKAKAVVEGAARRAGDLPYRAAAELETRGLTDKARIVKDFAEGALPGLPAAQNLPSLGGYGAKWLYDNRKK